MIHTNSYYASLGLGSHVLYIYVGGCSDRSTERGVRLEKEGVVRCCCSHGRSSVVEYAKLITTDSITLLKLLGRHCLSTAHGTEIMLLFFCKYCVIFPWAGMAQSV
jgi:hypothetical protein